MKRNARRRRYEELEDGYDSTPVQVIGLTERNVFGKMISKPVTLTSAFISTRCGIEYEASSQDFYCQMPLYSDLKDPLTLVSLRSPFID